MQKYIFYKNGIDSFSFSCTRSHKILWIHNILQIEMTGRECLIELLSLLFFTLLKLSNKVKKCLCSVCLFVRLSVHALTLVNILQSLENCICHLHLI